MPDREASETTNGAGLLDRAASKPRSSAEDAQAARHAALDQVRVYLNSLVEVLRAHPEPSLDLDESQWRLAELVDALATENPSAPRVQSRWIRLAPVLAEVRPDVPFDRLTELIKRAVGVA